MVMGEIELPWEKAKREYDEMTPEEQTWYQISTPPGSKVFYIDVGKLTARQASKYLERVKEALKNGKK